MGFYNNYQYVPEKPAFNVDEGVHTMQIKAVKQSQSKSGAAMLVIECAVDGANMPYVIYLVEGQYFDKTFSRFIDCFGITIIESASPDLWVMKTGSAVFDHQKYNGYTKSYNYDREIQCHLMPKEGFQQQPQQAQQQQRPLYSQQQQQSFNGGYQPQRTAENAWNNAHVNDPVNTF